MKKIRIALIFAVFLLTQFGWVYGADVTLLWNPVTEADGYKLYHGTATGVYGVNYDAGGAVQYELDIPNDDLTHYFVVTAYNTYGESDYSDEVNITLYIDGNVDNAMISWEGAEDFNSTLFGSTGKEINVSWDALPNISIYYVRLYDINKQVYLPQMLTESNSIIIITPKTGVYKIEIRPMGVAEWQLLFYRIVAWIAQPGPIIIE